MTPIKGKLALASAVFLGAGLVLAGCGVAARLSGKGSGSAKSAEAAEPGDPSLPLRSGGLAILTPTAASSEEEDRQTVALIFTKTLGELRPDLPTTPLATTLSSINAAGLADAYAHMYVAYKDAGLFDNASLQKIGRAVGARYLVQLKLASFDQSNSNGMFSFMGVSLGRQKTASARLFVQIWDSADGKVVWERSNEASEKKRSLLLDRSIKMEDIVKSDAQEIIKQLPHG